MSLRQFIIKYKSFVLYGISLGLLLFLLKWLELRFVIFDHAMEIYTGLIAVFFTALGIWLAVKLAAPKKETVVVEKTVYVNNNGSFNLNENAVQQLGLSKRELEVLQLIADGLSNNEIAGRLFLSLPTIKTHTSRIFEKLDVKRRTQAVEAAKRMGLIP